MYGNYDDLDELLRQRAQREGCPIPEGFDERLEEVLEMTMKEKRRLRAGARTALAAAVLSAALAVSVSAAALLGAFDFLKEQDTFQALGLNEVYDVYAYDVGATAVTPGGDVFTLERAAIDGTFFTAFYTYEYAEPLMSQAEFDALDAGDPWAAWSAAPFFALRGANGEEISLEGYNNSFEVQQYLSDPRTVRGAWRCLLTSPFWETCDGTCLTLQGYTWDSAAQAREEFAVELISHPNASVICTPDVSFPLNWAGKEMTIDVDSVKISPLGSLLTLRYDANEGTALGILDAFVLRDKDTGKYIPFARVWTRANSGGTDEVMDTYELFGDVRELGSIEHLELVPTWSAKRRSEQITVALRDLPSDDAGNAAGGYAPASYQVSGGRLIVELQPVGAVSATEASLLNGVTFLDKDGEEVFDHTSTAKFKDRQTGVITVVTTVEDPDFAGKVKEVDAIAFFAEGYSLLEDRAVTIPISGGLDWADDMARRRAEDQV